jgi:hypothetical protein
MERSPWSDIIGPVYSEASVLRELGMDAVQLERAVRWSQILRLITADGHQVYPAWQIRDGALVDGLQPVIETLRTGIEDPWTWAQWLSTPIDEVEGGDGVERAIDWLAAGRLAEVLRDAEHDAASWAR